jgi:hypothetical protein
VENFPAKFGVYILSVESKLLFFSKFEDDISVLDLSTIPLKKYKCDGRNDAQDQPVTRALMAIFLVRTFNLP